MANAQLIEYIRQQLQQGASRRGIKDVLLKAGWRDFDIEEAFSAVSPLLKTGEFVSAGQNSKSPAIGSGAKPAAKKFVLLGAIVAGALILVGGGAFAYFKIFQSPERVMLKMFSQLSELKSFKYAAKIEVKFNPAKLSAAGPANMLAGALDPNKPVSIFLDLKGSLNASDPEDVRNSSRLAISSDIIPFQGSSIGLEAKEINDMFYFKLDLPPSLLSIIAQFTGLDPSLLADQWVEVNPNSLQSGYQDKVEPLLGKAKEQLGGAQFTEEQKNKIKRLLLTDKFWTIKELPAEIINGADTYHYKIILDQEKTLGFIQKASKIVGEKPLTQEQLTTLKKGWSDLWINGEIWIGKKDFWPYRFNFKIGSDINKKDKSEVVAAMDFTSSQFNYPIKIYPPLQSEPLDKILEKISANLSASQLSTGTNPPPPSGF